MKPDLRLLKFPEVDVFKASIRKSVKGLSESDDPAYYQEVLLCELYNYYIQFEDCAEIQAILMKIQELSCWIEKFHGIPDE